MQRFISSLLCCGALLMSNARAAAPVRIFVAGDSTAASNGPKGPIGWAVIFQEYFDPAKAEVINCAKPGRSSRTFFTEGLWQALISQVRPGDVVLIQFGHNDSSPINDASRARGSIPSLGAETLEIDNMLTKRHEIVHSFGWYMGLFVDQAKAKGAIPIILSPTVRNIWKGGHIERGPGHYRDWSIAVAKREGIPCVDLTDLAADAAETLGSKLIGTYYPKDHTHTNLAGAEFNARWIVAGLKGIKQNPLDGTFSAKGREVPPAASQSVPSELSAKP